MRTRQESTPEKLRGGFYTPPALVDFCISRIAHYLVPGSRVLEPSIGDGAFLQGLTRMRGDTRVESVLGIEPFDIEAGKARRTLHDSSLTGDVITESAVSWAASTDQQFDIAVGNPPFVRYQFVSPADKRSAALLAERLNTTFGGVSNLWIPVLLGALSRVVPGGAFSFIVPTECFTGLSARAVRSWLMANSEGLRFDFFAPGSFPDVLQEVAVMSGVRGSNCHSIEIAEHDLDGVPRCWTHVTAQDATNWTQYLLPPDHLKALQEAISSPRIVQLGSIAHFGVSTVTGANDYFTAETATVEEFDLQSWALPLLPRLRHAQGLSFRVDDHGALASSDGRAWLLDFSRGLAPTRRKVPRSYIELGEASGLPERYKCRIRDPWYEVPCVPPGHLLLSKRSHRFPRVIVNEAAAFTTDTIYQGRLLAPDSYSPRAFTAGFHNSLTMLTSELEGRSFGGGVLELVPSEIARLQVPYLPSLEDSFPELDRVSEASHPEELIERTDALLTARGVFETDVLQVLSEARNMLLARRLGRNRRAALVPTESADAVAVAA
jgi:adenine-specific DNA-methyltransferase